MNKLCCVLNAKYTCKGCGTCWCKNCSDPSVWEQSKHPHIDRGEGWSTYTCPIAGMVIWRIDSWDYLQIYKP